MARPALGSAAARRPKAGSLRLSPLLWLVPAGCWYALLLSAGSAGLFAPVVHGLTFNSMLLHLLHGRFDVDPAVIGDEGFLRGGASYAYFGIFPALVRVPFLGLPGFAATDFTRLACLEAVSVMALFKVLAALAVGRRATGGRHSPLLGLLVAAILAGGAQTQFLRPSIYQETTLWADACAAVFVYLFLRGWLDDGAFTPRLLAGMAAAAGICLLTRVSTGLGLYLAFGFLWLRLTWCAGRAGTLRRELARSAVPAMILGAGVAVAAIVNYERWGNPLVFVDLTRQLIAINKFPDRLARVHEYGEFNPARLLFGLGYYFLPLWAWHGGGGLLWSAFRHRMFDSVELPPGSFLVSDPLLIGLAVYGIVHLARRTVPRRDLVWPVLGGLLVPIVLMLTAISLAFRYRLEFYPFLELAAFVGFARLLPAAGRRARLWCAAGAAFGIVAAQAMWLLYMLSPFGPVGSVVGPGGVLAFYRALPL